MNAAIIELAIAEKFNYRRNIICPNVFWGLGFRYEADVIVLYPSGWAVEIEIKTTWQDYKNDHSKFIFHNDKRIQRLYYAAPESLAKRIAEDLESRGNEKGCDLIGVLSCREDQYKNLILGEIRPAKKRGDARKFTEKERKKLLELLGMRVWRAKHDFEIMRRDRLKE